MQFFHSKVPLSHPTVTGLAPSSVSWCIKHACCCSSLACAMVFAFVRYLWIRLTMGASPPPHTWKYIWDRCAALLASPMALDMCRRGVFNPFRPTSWCLAAFVYEQSAPLQGLRFLQRLDMCFGFQLHYDSPLVVSETNFDPCAPSLALLLPALCVSYRNGCPYGTRTRNSHFHSVFGLARVHFWWFTLVGVRRTFISKNSDFGVAWHKKNTSMHSFFGRSIALVSWLRWDSHLVAFDDNFTSLRSRFVRVSIFHKHCVSFYLWHPTRPLSLMRPNTHHILGGICTPRLVAKYS